MRFYRLLKREVLLPKPAMVDFHARLSKPASGRGYSLMIRRWRMTDDAFDKASRWDQDPEPVLVLVPGAGTVTYDPFTDHRALYAEFSQLAPSPEACLAFATQYGRLGIAVGGIERVAAWQVRILWLRYLVKLWELAHVRSRHSLKEMVRFQDGRVTFFHLPDKWPMFESFSCTRHLTEQSVSLDVSSGTETSTTAARIFCLRMVNTALQEHGGTPKGFDLCWDSERQRPAFQATPTTLWATMLIQFALDMHGEEILRLCPGCGQWFVHRDLKDRKHKKVCSPTCRVRWLRRRREQILELHIAGLPANEIAEKTGSKLESIKRWTKREKGKRS